MPEVLTESIKRRIRALPIEIERALMVDDWLLVISLSSDNILERWHKNLISTRYIEKTPKRLTIDDIRSRVYSFYRDIRGAAEISKEAIPYPLPEQIRIADETFPPIYRNVVIEMTDTMKNNEKAFAGYATIHREIILPLHCRSFVCPYARVFPDMLSKIDNARKKYMEVFGKDIDFLWRHGRGQPIECPSYFKAFIKYRDDWDMDLDIWVHCDAEIHEAETNHLLLIHDGTYEPVKCI